MPTISEDEFDDIAERGEQMMHAFPAMMRALRAARDSFEAITADGTVPHDRVMHVRTSIAVAIRRAERGA